MKGDFTMYTMVPYRTRRDLGANRTRDLFDDRFFRSFFDMNDWMGGMGFRVDIHDNESNYLLEAELPGVSEEQINLSVEDDTLTISADMQSEKKDEKAYYCERRAGHVSRSFNLEGIRQDDITAEYRNGILYVTLPKDAPAKKAERRIPILSGEKADKTN